MKSKPAFVSSLLFAVHPVLTQAVAWVPGLNDLLLAMFFLASFIYLINYLKSGGIKDLFFYSLFFGLSIFTKENALTTIFVFIAAYFFLDHKRSFKKLISIIIPLIVSLALFFFLRDKAVDTQLTSSYLVKSIFGNLLGGFLVNFGKLFFPFNLSVMPILYRNVYVWGVLAVVLMSVVLLTSKKKNLSLILLGFAIFWTTFIPVLINPILGEKLVMYEHRMYIPLIGLLLMLLGTSAYLKSVVKKQFFMPALIVFFVISFTHMDNFKDQYVFWENAKEVIDIFPFAKANLAYVYYQDGKVDEAKKLILELAETDKFKDFALNNLGIIYMKEGRVEDAMNAYQEALKHNPLNSGSYLNMGQIYKLNGDLENAKKYFLFAVYTDNDNIDAMMNLASIYLDEGNVEKAQLIYDEVKKHGIEY